MKFIAVSRVTVRATVRIRPTWKIEGEKEIQS